MREPTLRFARKRKIAARYDSDRSKQEMARKLFERGSKLAFNTLRKYSREDLEAMLARADTQPADTQTATPAVTQVDCWPAKQPVDTPCPVPTTSFSFLKLLPLLRVEPRARGDRTLQRFELEGIKLDDR
jgi:hypothetical protein